MFPIQALRMRNAAAAAGGSGTIIPPTITSLEAWYNASTITDPNGTAEATWADSSGNGFTATNGGSSPLLQTNNINGLNTLGFTSSRNYTVSTTILNGATAASFAIVFANTNDPRSGGDFGALLDGFGTSVSASHHPYTDQTIYDGFATDTRKTVGDPAFSLTSPRIAVVRSATNDYTWHFDGTSFFSTATNTVGIPGSGSGSRVIGLSLAGAGEECRIAEICIFRSALTTTERQKMEGYFAWKWGLVANLPSGHPYKTSAP